MIALLYFILAALVSPFESKCRLEAENAALRYQLIVLRRKVRGRIRLTNGDRLVSIQLYRWGPLLRNHAPDIAAMDLFVVPTIGFDLLYAFIIIRPDRRDLVWINVTTHPTAEWIAHQITEAFPWNEARLYLIRDRDCIYGTIVTRRLQAMGIRDKPIASASPWQNSFAERLIGSIRRECVDHIVVLDEAHLRRILQTYACYYNEIRTHRKDAPVLRPVQRTGGIKSHPILGGLHYHYVRV